MEAKGQVVANTPIYYKDKEARDLLGEEELETEAQTCTGAINELKGTLDDLKNNTHKFSISTSDTTIVLPTVYRGILITCDSNSTRCGMWMIFSYSDGSANVVSMFSSATGITITNTSNGIKVKTNAGGSSGIIIDISKHVTSIN